MSTQISAYISDSTKQLVDAYVSRRGIKKGFLLEEALLHYLQALNTIPEDLIVPARLKLTESSVNQLVDTLASDLEPNQALKDFINEQ